MQTPESKTVWLTRDAKNAKHLQLNSSVGCDVGESAEREIAQHPVSEYTLQGKQLPKSKNLEAQLSLPPSLPEKDSSALKSGKNRVLTV